MSTPTTAVATFPHHHPHHYPHPHPHPHSPYAHSHHQHQQGHQPGVSANYRPAATGTANNNNASSTNASQNILPSPWTTSAAAASSTAATADSSSLPSLTSATNGGGRASYRQQSSNTAYHSPQPPRPPPHGQQPRSQNSTTQSKYVDDAPSGQDTTCDNTQYTTAAMAEPARKRRRSRGPDWQEFYRNGLPDEIIVIADDTPEPEANTSRKVTNGANTNTTAHATNSAAANGSAARQPTKKRRRDDDPATASSGPGYHVQYVESHTSTPAGSTISSDRTNSALHTTAPTSLSSQSQYDESQLPAKRKRTTRQQVANEAKRRDTDVLGNRCFTYKPPPYPPKKAPDVHVRVVQDVSLSSPDAYVDGPQLTLIASKPPGQKNLKVDDDDGHYIVVPDASLTEKCKFPSHISAIWRSMTSCR